MLIPKIVYKLLSFWPFLPLFKGFNIGGQIGFSRAFLSLKTVSVNHFLTESCRFIYKGREKSNIVKSPFGKAGNFLRCHRIRKR